MKSEIFENEDGKFIVFPNDAIAQHLKTGKLWESHYKKVVLHIIPTNAVVLDCGANFGYNAVVLANTINIAQMYCFEPQRIVFQQLAGNLILNNIYNAQAVNCALGNTDGALELNPVNYESEWVNIGDTSLGEGGEICNIAQLDSFDLKHVDFIKLDVQGSELSVLEGAEKLIERSLPDIFIEIEEHQLAKFDVKKEQIFDFLKSRGYRIWRIENEYPCDHICVTKDFDRVTNSLWNDLNLVEV
jgi:FkbM family methyltransferase